MLGWYRIFNRQALSEELVVTWRDIRTRRSQASTRSAEATRDMDKASTEFRLRPSAFSPTSSILHVESSGGTRDFPISRPLNTTRADPLSKANSTELVPLRLAFLNLRPILSIRIYPRSRVKRGHFEQDDWYEANMKLTRRWCSPATFISAISFLDTMSRFPIRSRIFCKCIGTKRTSLRMSSSS